jgi:hypothetical protein
MLRLYYLRRWLILLLTTDEVTQIKALLTALYGDMVITLGYRGQIEQCLRILSKHPIDPAAGV